MTTKPNNVSRISKPESTRKTGKNQQLLSAVLGLNADDINKAKTSTKCHSKEVKKVSGGSVLDRARARERALLKQKEENRLSDELEEKSKREKRLDDVLKMVTDVINGSGLNSLSINKAIQLCADSLGPKVSPNEIREVLKDKGKFFKWDNGILKNLKKFEEYAEHIKGQKDSDNDNNSNSNCNSKQI